MPRVALAEGVAATALLPIEPERRPADKVAVAVEGMLSGCLTVAGVRF